VPDDKSSASVVTSGSTTPDSWTNELATNTAKETTMRKGELSESALDLLLTDIVVWPGRVLYRALSGGRPSAPATASQATCTSTPSWHGAIGG
jgi:hypothetical protein